MNYHRMVNVGSLTSPHEADMEPDHNLWQQRNSQTADEGMGEFWRCQAHPGAGDGLLELFQRLVLFPHRLPLQLHEARIVQLCSALRFPRLWAPGRVA